MNTDLTAAQLDYAVFLPALSGFFSSYIGKQRHGNYVDPARIPTNFAHGVESMNYLNSTQGAFQYSYSLYSAGHANLDLNKFDANEDMVRNTGFGNTQLVDNKPVVPFLLLDSGGYQIARLRPAWRGNWLDPNCPNATKKRQQVLSWMEGIGTYGMTLDVPMWAAKDPDAKAAIGIGTYREAVVATHINNEYFINNRTGKCKLLNVLQGENHAGADMWYDEMKKYSDTKIYGDRAFNGWAMGGQNMSSMTLVLRRICTLIEDGLLETGQHDWMHFLGTGQLEWACAFTDIQRAVRKYHNPNFTISFDCASAFLATANGQVYTHNEMDDRKKWIYRMTPALDDKKYSTDPRLYKDAVIQDGFFKKFEPSPIMDQMKVSDICYYKPGQLNKINKVGKTSWDSFSYALMMGHNVWMHINAVQEANRRYDSGMYPRMLIREQFDRYTFREFVEELFTLTSFTDRLELIKKHDRFLMGIIGKRLVSNRKEVSASTYFGRLFDEGDDIADEEVTVDDMEIDDVDDYIADHITDQ